MVTKDQIREEELTTDDVLDRETAEPQPTVEWVPEWDESEDARPGENARIEDETLIWERNGFEVRLESTEMTHWRAVVSVPDEYGQSFPRPIDIKTARQPEPGHVEAVEMDSYTLDEVTLLLSTNFQPTYELNEFVDYIIESDEGMEEFQQEITEKMAVARENED